MKDADMEPVLAHLQSDHNDELAVLADYLTHLDSAPCHRLLCHIHALHHFDRELVMRLSD